MHGDHAARQLILHAFLYYVLDAPIISDSDYDALSSVVATKWNELTPDRKWALGSAKTIRSTGYHIKFSSHAAEAAVRLHMRLGRPNPNLYVTWKYRKDGCRYITTTL